MVNTIQNTNTGLQFNLEKISKRAESRRERRTYRHVDEEKGGEQERDLKYRKSKRATQMRIRERERDRITQKALCFTRSLTLPKI